MKIAHSVFGVGNFFFVLFVVRGDFGGWFNWMDWTDWAGWTDWVDWSD
jgi:hypothetical protein